ncbi:MAG: acyl-CoA dehydrogenase family protein [Novosphingobium sp.]|nr:acyl-CoA dehydrogenase family protein [Novosphingobium sp.]
MNFDLSEDEEMLKALAERFVSDHYDLETRRGFLAEAHGFSESNWNLLGELGLIAAPFDEDQGGMSLDATGIAVVFEALGRGLVVEPLIENVLVAGRLFAATAKPELRDEWLPSLLAGERRIAFAHAEFDGRPGRPRIETSARIEGARTILNGEKACVPAGSGADAYIVSARTGGDASTLDQVALYFVPADAEGLSARAWRLADGNCAVTLSIDDVAIEDGNTLCDAGGGIALIDDLASLARSAEALGIMERMFEETAIYLRTREQFGAKLSSLQALQHRMVAQYAVIEQCRGLLHKALVSFDTPEFGKSVQGLRAFISPASVELGHEMIQFHGGMGVTDELIIGHAHKRLLVLSRWPDDPLGALDRYAQNG